MDKYINQFIAEIQMTESAQKVLKNILDEPISERVKGRLLKLLFPKKIDLQARLPRGRTGRISQSWSSLTTASSEHSPNIPGLSPRDSGGVRRRAEKETSLLPNALGNRKLPASLADGHVCQAPSGGRPQRISRRCAPKYTRETYRRDLGSRWRQIQLALKVSLRKQSPDGTEEFTDPVLRHKQKALLQASEIIEALDEAISHLLELLEKWSGWVVDQVQILWVDIAGYKPLRGGSYIPLPAALRNKKAVFNVKNTDDHCLRWALRAALAYPWPPQNQERPRWYPNENGLNFQGIDSPTPISQIPKVEKRNNLAINVFVWDKGVTVNRLSIQPDGIPRINLLLIEEAGKHHFTWIKDLNRLLYDQS